MTDAAYRTRVLPRTSRRTDDEQLVQLIQSLPVGPDRGPARRIGIMNERGSIYREVTLHSVMEMLHFSARMNSLGFAVHRQRSPRDHGRHEMVFAGR